MATIIAFCVTQHSQIFFLEIEFNKMRFINYTIPRLCSTYAVAAIAGPDRDQDQESTSVQDIFTFTMNVCEVQLLIRSIKGLVCPSEKSNRQFFPEEFNKKKYHKVS